MKKKFEKDLKDIFQELKKGNRDFAIEELYKNYKNMVYGIAFSILKEKQDSEDVVQVVFSKLYMIDDTKIPTTKEFSWIYSVTKNEALTILRKKKKTINLEDIYDLEEENHDIDKLIDRETYNKLICKLDEKEKEIISLKIISNLSFKEISELLGETIGSVKWKYYKAVYTLKILLSNMVMFIATVIANKTLSEKKKNIENERLEKEENILIDSNGPGEELVDNKVIEEQESTIMLYDKENIINYTKIGLTGFSTIFFILTFIFSIFCIKYQLKVKKKTSK